MDRNILKDKEQLGLNSLSRPSPGAGSGCVSARRTSGMGQGRMQVLKIKSSFTHVLDCTSTKRADGQQEFIPGGSTCDPVKEPG